MTDDPRLVALDQVPFILAVCEGPELRVLSLSAATRAVLPGREWAGRPGGRLTRAGHSRSGRPAAPDRLTPPPVA